MANITRYDPFGELDDIFRGFFVRPMSIDPERALHIKMDVSEDDRAYTVHAEIPGVKKEDIDVDINGNQVSIGAEVRREREEKQDEKVVHAERYYGKVSRVFSLAQEVDEATAQARYDAGVLELTLPKKAVVSARKLAVQ